LPEFIGRDDCFQFAAAQYGDARTYSQSLKQIVSNENGRHVVLLAELCKLLLHVVTGDRIESSKRFIEEEQGRLCGERARDSNPLTLAAGELSRIAFSEFRAAQPDLFEKLDSATPLFVFGPTEQLRYEGDIASNGPVRQQPKLLDDVTGFEAKLNWIQFSDILAIEQDSAAGWFEDPVNQPERGGFARPATSEKNERFAALDRETKAIQNSPAIDGITDRIKDEMGQRSSQPAFLHNYRTYLSELWER